MFDRGSKNRLNHHSLPLFHRDSLFDRIARVVCAAECLPRKELYECWELARRAHRRFERPRVLDLGASHGLLGLIFAVLNQSSTVVAIDRAKPKSADKLFACFVAAWPHIQDRFSYIETSADKIEIKATDLVVSAHGCGSFTDDILAAASHARAAVVVMPCCHNLKESPAGSLAGWIDGSLALDVRRVIALERRGYTVVTQHIDEQISPKNRLLLAAPNQ